METTEWITVLMACDEYELSHDELCIEVRVYWDDEELIAEPTYYKLVDGNGKIIMDCGVAGSQADGRMWKFVERAVESNFTEDHLDWMLRYHSAFEKLRE